MPKRLESLYYAQDPHPSDAVTLQFGIPGIDLVRTCRQIHAEAAAYLYYNSKFDVVLGSYHDLDGLVDDAADWLSCIGRNVSFSPVVHIDLTAMTASVSTSYHLSGQCQAHSTTTECPLCSMPVKQIVRIPAADHRARLLRKHSTSCSKSCVQTQRLGDSLGGGDFCLPSIWRVMASRSSSVYDSQFPATFATTLMTAVSSSRR